MSYLLYSFEAFHLSSFMLISDYCVSNFYQLLSVPIRAFPVSNFYSILFRSEIFFYGFIFRALFFWFYNLAADCLLGEFPAIRVVTNIILL